MDQKMKNFDRSIEQMMNENAVTPPFGAWNRIATQLDAEVGIAAPAAVSSPVPHRTMLGLVAGALIIGSSLVTAYVVSNYSNADKPLTSTVNFIAPAVTQPQVIKETPVVLAKEEVKAPAQLAKHKTAKPVEKQLAVTEEPVTTLVPKMLPIDAEVLVPTTSITTNNVQTEPYYFPGIDITSYENKMVEKNVALVAKTVKPAEKSTNKERLFASSNKEPRIKFKPKKHRPHTYGRYNRLKN